MEEQLAKDAAEEAGFDANNGDIWIVDVCDDTKVGESVNWVFKPLRETTLEHPTPSIWALNDGKNIEIAKTSKNGDDVVS